MPVRVEQLGERRAAAHVRVDEPVLVVGVRGRLVRLRAERLVDGGEQLPADAVVDEEADPREHDRHRRGERERQPHTDRQPVHVVARSR